VGLGLGLLLGTARPILAQDSGCAPVPVAEGSGIYFLVLSELCDRSLADGYSLIADLARDDQPQELLVLVDSGSDQQTRLVAQVLANEVKVGGVDGSTWHVNAVGGEVAAAQPTDTASMDQPPPEDAGAATEPAADDAGSSG
jgi:hypothetical protein